MRLLDYIYHAIVPADAPLRLTQPRDPDASYIAFIRFFTEASLAHGYETMIRTHISMGLAPMLGLMPERHARRLGG